MKLTLKEHLRRGARLVSDADYRKASRERKRLGRVPRFTPALTTLLGPPFEIVDSLSFLEMYEDIWEREAYRFPRTSEKPLVLDGGANVGVGVTYFKRLYPDSEVIAFEPDDKIFPVLKRNVEGWGLQGVTLIPHALWREETDLAFLAEGSYGGRIARQRDPAAGKVRAVRLRNYLDRRIDLLKLDIEEGETEILEDCSDRLDQVRHLFVEYHGDRERPQTLPRLLYLLSTAGFRLNLQAGRDSPRPFMARKLNMGNDLQVEIYAFRETPSPGSRI